jgi:ParB-like chromosome segregation protein Spo0J
VTHVEDRTSKARHEKKVAALKDNGKPSEPPKAVEVVFVPLSDIYADFAFNSRSEANVASEPDSAPGGGLEELSASLRTKGQDFPVILRPNLHQKGKDRKKDEETGRMQWWWPPYELVDGFRRDVAITALNANKKNQEASKETGLPIVPGVPNGHIAAEVKPFDDREATLFNIRAGVGRNNLEPPDLLAAIVKLTRPPFSMSVQEISDDLACSLATVHRYATIGNALLPVIANHWRFGGAFDGVTANRRLSLDELGEVAKEEKDKQTAAYKELLIGRVEKQSTFQWFNSAEKSALRMGSFLAKLEIEGVIKLTSKPWEECVNALVRLPVSMRDKVRVRSKIAAAIQEGYDGERKRDETRKRGPEEP